MSTTTTPKQRLKVVELQNKRSTVFHGRQEPSTALPAVPAKRSAESTAPERRADISAWLRVVMQVAGAFVTALGAAVLCGHALGIVRLVQILPHTAAIRANAGLCFLFTGLSLLFVSRPRPKPWSFLAFPVLIISG